MPISKRPIYVAVILLILVVYPALPIGVDANFDVIRIGFDQVIEEKDGGVTYIRIDRDLTGVDIWSAIFKLRSAKGPGEVNRTIVTMERQGKIKEVMQRFLEILPDLERSAGLQYWSTIRASDEEPPALYIGLYNPTEAHLRAIAEAMENATKSRGVILRFYEALSPRSLKDELIAASDSLWKRSRNGSWDPNIPISGAGVPDPPGGLEVIVDYTKTGRTYPDDEYVTKVTRAVRSVVGYKIPLVVTFPKKFRLDLEAGGVGGLGGGSSGIVTDILYPNSVIIFNYVIPILVIGLTLLTVGYVSLRRKRSRLKRYPR